MLSSNLSKKVNTDSVYSKIEVDDKTKIYSEIIDAHAVSDTTSELIPGFPYIGYLTLVPLDKYNSLINQGYTILGANIIKGPLNDTNYGNNAAAYDGMILSISSVGNIPYQACIASRAYQTMRIDVVIYYKK